MAQVLPSPAFYFNQLEELKSLSNQFDLYCKNISLFNDRLVSVKKEEEIPSNSMENNQFNSMKEEEKQIEGKKRDEKVARPPNSFLLFSNATRFQLKLEFPELSNAQISKKLGEEWKKLHPDVKRNYRKRAEEIKKRFDQAHPDFIYNRKRIVRDSEPVEPSALEFLRNQLKEEENVSNKKQKTIQTERSEEEPFNLTHEFGSDDVEFASDNFDSFEEINTDSFFSDPLDGSDDLFPFSPIEDSSSLGYEEDYNNGFNGESDYFASSPLNLEESEYLDNQQELPWPFNIFPQIVY